MTKHSNRGIAGRYKPFQEWPENDQVLRARALMPGDVIDGEGPLAAYRSPTLRFCDQGNGRWLQWLDNVGELDPDQSPALRVTPDRIRRHVEDLLRINQPKAAAGRLEGLFYMLRAIDPGHDLSCLRSAITRLRGR